jgi:hypothetical protein
MTWIVSKNTHKRWVGFVGPARRECIRRTQVDQLVVDPGNPNRQQPQQAQTGQNRGGRERIYRQMLVFCEVCPGSLDCIEKTSTELRFGPGADEAKRQSQGRNVFPLAEARDQKGKDAREYDHEASCRAPDFSKSSTKCNLRPKRKLNGNG